MVGEGDAMEERIIREAIVATAVHSVEMEDGRVSDEYLRDAQDYISGLIDEQGLINRTRIRYGLDSE